MTTMYNYALLDPRPAGKDSNEAIFASGPVFGVEITIPALARRCVENLDHHGINTTVDTPSAAEQALTCGLPQPGVTLATVRADADSITAMAVLELRSRRVEFDKRLVEAIGAVDRKGPQAGVFAGFKRSTIAIARVAADFKRPLEERVLWVMDALTGQADPGEIDELVAARDAEFEAAKAASNVSVAGSGKVAVVVSGHRFATNLGYEVADIVVAFNPQMPVDFKDASKGTYAKFTICIRDEHVDYDIKAAVNHLNDLEGSRREDGLRWGGSATIAGSPQGVSSKLSLDEVVQVVESYLK